jgi:cytochrome d ubiquinol oxidase subunit I
MRTADAVSPVPGASLLTTLVLFVVVYGGVFGAGVYYMARLIRTGPLDFPPAPDATPARPLSAPGDAIEGRP